MCAIKGIAKTRYGHPAVGAGIMNDRCCPPPFHEVRPRHVFFLYALLSSSNWRVHFHSSNFQGSWVSSVRARRFTLRVSRQPLEAVGMVHRGVGNPYWSMPSGFAVQRVRERSRGSLLALPDLAVSAWNGRLNCSGCWHHRQWQHWLSAVAGVSKDLRVPSCGGETGL